MFATPRYADYPAATPGTASYSGGQWIDDRSNHHPQWQSEHALAAGTGSASTYPSLAPSAQDNASIQPADTYTDYSYPSYFPDRAAVFPSTSSASLNNWTSSHTSNYHYYTSASGSESSNTSSPLQSNASATSSLPSSPASGYGQHSELSAFSSPTPLSSAYARTYTLQTSPPPQPRAQHRVRTGSSKSKPDSTVHAFSLTTLEPLDASDDPYPVSMTDLMRNREDFDYGGLSYRFALPNSVAAAAVANGSTLSSGRCTPISDNDVQRETMRRSPEKDKRKPKVKLHPCEVCGKAFPRPSGLKTHMNSHSGEKPFPCPVADCNKTFTVRSNAKRHLRTHGIIPDAPSVTSNTGTIDFDTPVVAEDIAEAHIDGRKMRIRWHGARPAGRDRDEPLPRSVRGTEKESRSTSATSSTLASPVQIPAQPPTPPPAPRATRQSAPSISYALGTPNYL
ncbi:unnamed protein product [Peniophora sp. CBMAI 1063]|nr:unnamed protein product [Peniophora sp. CBMAI 1063]